MTSSKEFRISDIDWCNETGSPCPYKGGSNCGIREHLKEFPNRSSQKKEARRLLLDAEKDPETYHRICGRGLEIIL